MDTRRDRSRSRERDDGGHRRRRKRRKRRSPPPRMRPPLRGTLWDMLPQEAAELGILAPPPHMVPPSMDAMRGGGPSMGAPAHAAKRVFVGQVPPDTTADALGASFNAALREAALAPADGPDPVVDVILKLERSFAFLDLATPELASAAQALDGLPFGQAALVVSRPRGYVAAPGAPPPYPSLYRAPGPVGDAPPVDAVPSDVAVSPYRLVFAGLPLAWTRDTIIATVSAEAPVAALKLETGPDGSSLGYGMLMLHDPRLSFKVVAALDGRKVDGATLRMYFAPPAPVPGAPSLPAPRLAASTIRAPAIVPTPVVRLFNMVVEEELLDPDEVADIKEDVQEEASEYGTVLAVEVPRPEPGKKVPGVGSIFVRFASTAEAEAGLAAMAGRTFGDRTVVGAYFDEDKFVAGDYS